MGCGGVFEPEAATARVLRSDEGSCVVLLLRPSGDLRLDLHQGKQWEPGRTPVEQGDIEELAAGAGLKGSPCDPWEKVSARLCLLTSYVGSVPLQTKTGASLQPFAVSSLNAHRAAKQCGAPVYLDPGTPPVPMKAAVTGRGVEARFPLSVCLDAESGPCQNGVPALVVTAALQVTVGWNRITNGMTMSLQFLGTDPDACSIGSSSVPNGGASHPWIVSLLGVMEHGPVGAWQDDGCNESRKLNNEAATSAAVDALERLVLEQSSRYIVPEAFAFEEEWPKCTMPVKAQGLCASSHALAAVGAWEKQVCALSGGRHTNFSVQWPLQCAPRAADCMGGKPEDVYMLFYAEGAIPEACAPYREPRTPEGTQGSFDIPEGFEFLGHQDSAGDCRETRLRVEGHPDRCPLLYARGPTNDEEAVGIAAALNSSRVPVVRVGMVRGERMIKSAILAYGAVVALIDVYADFLDYDPDQDGVYIRAEALTNADCLGRLAVQLVGWGSGPDREGRTRPHWIGEASFGPDWGRGGRFWWLRGQDHLGIERQAWHPLVDKLELPGERSSSHGAVDRLSSLAERSSAAGTRLEEQRQLSQGLIAVNITGALVALVVGCATYIWQNVEWPFDAPSGHVERSRARQYRYSAVATE